MTNLARNGSRITKALGITVRVLGLGAVMLFSDSFVTADPQPGSVAPNSSAEVAVTSAPQEALPSETGRGNTSPPPFDLGIEPEPAPYVYNPSGKRDPFVPFDFSQPAAPPDPANPLTGFDYKELRLSSVLAGGEEPIAIVEDSTGRGFTVRRGTKIGKAGGTVVEIQRDKLVIQEHHTEADGGKKIENVELLLRAATAADQESLPRRTR